MNDKRRIESLSESPCSKCEVSDACDKRIDITPALSDIKYCIYGNKEYDYRECPIYIAVTSPDMVEEDD